MITRNTGLSKISTSENKKLFEVKGLSEKKKAKPSENRGDPRKKR